MIYRCSHNQNTHCMGLGMLLTSDVVMFGPDCMCGLHHKMQEICDYRVKNNTLVSRALVSIIHGADGWVITLSHTLSPKHWVTTSRRLQHTSTLNIKEDAGWARARVLLQRSLELERKAAKDNAHDAANRNLTSCSCSASGHGSGVPAFEKQRKTCTSIREYSKSRAFTAFY